MSRADSLPSAERCAAILDLWADGLTLAQIAVELESTSGAISVAIAKMRAAGVDVPYRRRGFSDFPHSAGSYVERRTLMALHRKGWSERLDDLTPPGPCAYCGGTADAVDHIDSRRSGGRTEPENLTRACTPCNSAKGSMPLLMFMLWRRVTVEASEATATMRALRSTGHGRQT